MRVLCCILAVRGTMKCEVCEKEEAKYKCPRCERRTCSLACVTAHKQRDSCSGKRDRTAFLSVSEFDDNKLIGGMHAGYAVGGGVGGCLLGSLVGFGDGQI